MKRTSCILLILAACLCGEGCRRGRSEPGDPVKVLQEKDLKMSQSEKSLVFSVRPKDRRIKIYVKNLKNVEAELKALNDPAKAKELLASLFASQEAFEQSKDGQDLAAKQR